MLKQRDSVLRFSFVLLLHTVVEGATLLPNDDVSVRPGRGNLDEADPLGLLVKAGGSASFIEFTFGSQAASAAILTLHNFWTNQSAPVNYNVRIRAAPYDFDETTLTAASQPDDSGWTIVVDSFHVDNQQRVYRFDITEFYNSHLGQTITFSLRDRGGTGDGPIFDDREGTGGHTQGPAIEVSYEQVAPVIEEVTPDPETIEAGTAYERQLVLLRGTLPVSWSLGEGPPGLSVNQSGLVSGWLPTEGDVGETFTITVEASNAFGSDTESWDVTVVAPAPNPMVGGGWVAHLYKPEGAVTDFPDLNSLEVRNAAIVTLLEFEPTEEQFMPFGLQFVDDFAVRFEGRITLPDGVTAFHLTADDAARLFVGGNLVVEKTSGGGFTEASGTIKVPGGDHCIVVEYFEHTGAAGLRLEYTPPGGERTLIPPAVMRPMVCLSEQVRVPAWRIFQVALTGSLRPANPFTDIQLTAAVTAPDGRAFTVDGFFDGDGRGSQEGNVWKLRFTPDRPGLWQWKADSNDPFLAEKGGEFLCLASEEQGAVTAQGRYFFLASGGPIYLMGNFLDRAAPQNEQYSHTLLSERISEENRQNMIRRHRDYHLANKINVYLANRGDYGGISTTPWLGSATANDKTRFELARWKKYDRIVAQLRDEGMAAELWFFADDSNFGSLPDAERRLLLRYAMARMSAYSHTLFVLCLEWQEGWSASQVTSDASYIQEHNPWKRLLSVHGTTGNFAFPNDTWADFMATQSGNSITPPENNAHTTANRNLAEKPLIVEEFGHPHTLPEKRVRGNLWAAFLGGAAGSGTGSDLGLLRVFLDSTQIPFWEMVPQNSLASCGFVLAKPGEAYAVYVENGGTFTLNLADGRYEAAWFNPRSSAGTEGPMPAGHVEGGTRSFTTPDGNDWVLWVKGLPPGPFFIRGEANADGKVDLADAVFILSFLFAEAQSPPCTKSADANDDGRLDLADAISLLSYLFAGRAPLPAPFPDCGEDTTEDTLSCEAFPPCGVNSSH